MITSGAWSPSFDPSGRHAAIEPVVRPVRLEVDNESRGRAPSPALRSPDKSELCQVRVAKTTADTSAAVIEPAAAIVEGALGQRVLSDIEIDHVASCGWIHDSPCPRCFWDM